MSVGATLVPSTFTTDTPVTGRSHAPLGTYDVTLFPTTSVDNALAAWHAPESGNRPIAEHATVPLYEPV